MISVIILKIIMILKNFIISEKDYTGTYYKNKQKFDIIPLCLNEMWINKLVFYINPYIHTSISLAII